MGKHTKRITTGAWSKDGLLALAGDDKMLTITDESGDTVRQTQLKDQPFALMFSERKEDVKSQLLEGTISLVLNKRTIYLYSIDRPDNPIELAFQSKYGSIVNYHWYGDGYIIIGFAQGYITAVSTHAKEIGTVI